MKITFDMVDRGAAANSKNYSLSIQERVQSILEAALSGIELRDARDLRSARTACNARRSLQSARRGER